MTPKQAKAFMAELEQTTTVAHHGVKVNRPVISGGKTVLVEARANRIGFVYWYFDGKPLPRKRVQGLLEQPGVSGQW